MNHLSSRRNNTTETNTFRLLIVVIAILLIILKYKENNINNMQSQLNKLTEKYDSAQVKIMNYETDTLKTYGKSQ